MAFDSLSERLNRSMRNIIGKGKLTDANMEDMLKEVRLALLEADVNYRIVKSFLDDVREKARGEDVLNSVEPGEMLVKIVHDDDSDINEYHVDELKIKEKRRKERKNREEDAELRALEKLEKKEGTSALDD